MAKIAKIIKSHGGVPAIQLAHAGRKGSVQRPWHGNDALDESDFARGEMPWEVVSSSEVPMFPHWLTPKALSVSAIGELLENYRRVTRRALEAGFEVIEIHGAHGYLLNQFWSPLCNARSDDYGGSFAKRMRLPLEVTEAVRGEWPEAKPLFYRCSASDEAEGGITIEDTVALAKELKTRGVDVIDCSAGGVARASATMGGRREGEGAYVPYAREVKHKGDVMTMAVKLIHRPEHAEEILQDGAADLIALGRELLHEPNWPLHAAERLGVDPEFALWPPQHGWWLVRRKRAEGF
jgi:2,4-dienoyl-CoA reductase-like NADH-dependent reductase (Old Yellow Enzyme family)